MTEKIEDVKERIYGRLNGYFVYAYGRYDRRSWNLLTGALDALFESGNAAS